MEPLAARTFRLVCALLAGAQLFFAMVAAQVVFPAEVAALPRTDARRMAAADGVGQMLARLDAATMVGCALAVLCAVWLSQRSGANVHRGGLLALVAGLCAAGSALGTTPAIHALRAAGETSGPRFGMMHALSTGLLLLEMILLVLASLARLGGGPRVDGAGKSD